MDTSKEKKEKWREGEKEGAKTEVEREKKHEML